MDIIFEPIGEILTPYASKEGMPIQPTGGIGVKGRVVLKKELCQGLTDLMGFSHILLIYYFHLSDGFELLTMPFLDTTKHGVFATRAPKRPNQIGISVVKLIGIDHHILYIENIDIINKTPLLDIKPYIPAFDTHEVERCGWTNNRTDTLKIIRSDHRFT
ncbi:MAG: tRNA (N6-threonylcarbamoyladenosine(37)-N6)-methyltransferase TrmO [Bacteroidales bacterium]|nr:tRNA (N6-threonylcarbamoyladenosine(37)-N6)-methyltransferase TrmO [Bacteroidales bacterium]MDD2324296.1 tRNA (N6-threonylcarbamoyladenosine(37)-N6)-methyltransferase TrmO [Bacteroidales bacterium]MDD3010000.1 tRNA (N6-threonylcarbamoyladenosine(37)-N6)-methyltransferase TrmO [Bacteroidales bacterium]MDD3960582.1 tRNA (N6-threonylcarbamoyladenosine(37)-N6)-methyltransferase TrmO [Bacteroidales bacterium]MDY0284820.1 tRNA (N6-threonylcarbamoyladenosine(37)-N6)-methyltransferase TrmO [Bacteroi